MNEKLPYYKRFPKDYLSDENVALMTLEQEGAYNRLMDYCWLQGSIPDDMESLARLCRVGPEKMAELWTAIRPCFRETEGGRLSHPRMDKERRAALEKKRKLSEAGKRGRRKQLRENDSGATPGPPPDEARTTPGHPQKAESETDTEPETTPTGGGEKPDGAREDPGPSSSPPEEEEKESDLDRLVSHLGEPYRDAVATVAETSRKPQRWAKGFLGMYGPSGTQEHLLSSVPEDERGEVLGLALQRIATEGEKYRSNWFEGIIRSLVRERSETPPGPDFGDESARDASRRHEARRRASEKQMRQVEEESAEAKAEMAELWAWWDDVDEHTRTRIQAKAKRRAGGVPKEMQRAILIGVIQEHRGEESEAAA